MDYAAQRRRAQHREKYEEAARATLAALEIVQSSGGNSARIGDKYDDVIIARTAWDAVLAAIAQAKAAGIGK